MLNKKIALSLFAICSLSAQADMVSVESSFGTQGSSTDVSELSPLAQTLQLDTFDTTLGDLTGVTITVYAQIDSAGTSTNDSDENGRADVEIQLQDAWAVSTSAADDYVFADASFDALVSDQSSAPNTFTLATGDTFEYAVSTGERSAQLMNVNMDAFLGDDPVEFFFSTDARTNLQNQVDGGTGTFTNMFSTGAWGRVVVDFEYTTEQVMVSAPGALGVAGLGLFAVAFVARRKNQK